MQNVKTDNQKSFSDVCAHALLIGWQSIWLLLSIGMLPLMSIMRSRVKTVCVSVHVCLRVFVKTGEGVRRGDPDVTFILILLHHHI